MIKLILALLFLPSIIVIGMCDYAFFGYYNPNKKWYSYLPSTFIEVLLFYAGIGIGLMLATN